MTTTEAVEKVLEEHPQSREIGSFNTWMYLINVMRKLKIRVYVNFEDLKTAPSPESILKIRRDVMHKQNKFNDDPPGDEEGIITYHPRDENQNN